MDEERVIGIQRMREDIKARSLECDAYKKALENITKANTVGEMLTIAYGVLSENRK